MSQPQKDAKRGPRGHKRKGEPPAQHESIASQKIDETSPVIQAFKGFQAELDSRYDKYERLIKLSRDVTIHSKRIIFQLHRIVGESNKDEVLAKAEKDLTHVQNTYLKSIAKELVNEDFYCYLRAYSPGLQEYIEASSFFYYVKEETLVTLQRLQEELIFKTADLESKDEEEDGKANKPLKLVIPPLEYMLGLADLTGELMRRCINSLCSGDLKEPFKLCSFLQLMYDGFSSFGNLGGRELSRKTNILLQSLRKVENACYTLKVRGSEMPNYLLEDVFAANDETAFNLDV